MPTLIFRQRGTEITFASDGGDSAITGFGLTATNGRAGARFDVYGSLGATGPLFECRFGFKAKTTPVVGEMAELYFNTWNEAGDVAQMTATDSAGTMATGDDAFASPDKLLNLQLVAVATVDQAATEIFFGTKRVVEINSRYISPVVWNATADQFATDGYTILTLTPLHDEIQD